MMKVTKINNQSVFPLPIGNYVDRVNTDGGTVENVRELLNAKGSICIIPSGKKIGKIYAVNPTNGTADITITRPTTPSYTDRNGNIVNALVDEPVIDYVNGEAELVISADDVLTAINVPSNTYQIVEHKLLGNNIIQSPSATYTTQVGRYTRIEFTLYADEFSEDFTTKSDGNLSENIFGATWEISSGKAINTPIETPFAINDGDLEVWTDVNNLTHWNKNIPSGGSLDRSVDVHNGTYSAQITVNASGTRTEISQNALVTLGKFYTSRAWGKSSVDAKYLRLVNDNQLSNVSQTQLNNTSFTEMINSSFRKTASGYLMLQNYGNANVEYTVDNVTVNILDTKSVFATTTRLRNLMTVKGYTTPRAGTFSGVVMNIDNPNNPQNYVALVKEGGDDNVVKLWKMVSGVMTQISSLTVSGYNSTILLELRQETIDTYQIYVNGIKESTPFTITEPTINSNEYHGLISTIQDTNFEYFSCRYNRDTVTVPNGGDIEQYIKYMSSGDTLKLANNGSYVVPSGDSGFATLPSGDVSNTTKVDGANATINGGVSNIRVDNNNYIEFKDLKLRSATSVICTVINNSSYITFNNIDATSSESTLIDCFKNQWGANNLTFNKCTVYLTIDTGVLTVDGFEDWEVYNITYNNCLAYGFKNGVSAYNNGHGFEVYAGNTATDEHCENITYNRCISHDCRVGFSSEGGVPQVDNINVRAIDCTSYNQDIADAGGVDGSSIKVTSGTLLVRVGNVTDI